jgi:hypothetical protein
MTKIAETIELTKEESLMLFKLQKELNLSIHEFVNKAVRTYINTMSESLENNEDQEETNYTNIWK